MWSGAAAGGIVNLLLADGYTSLAEWVFQQGTFEIKLWSEPPFRIYMLRTDILEHAVCVVMAALGAGIALLATRSANKKE